MNHSIRFGPEYPKEGCALQGIFTAWLRILRGYRPLLSIEITRECPLRCPGCYAYNDEHLGGGVNLRQVTDFKGKALTDQVLKLVARYKPLHVSIVGGEPLVRYRELSELLPILLSRVLRVQLVTSAVRPIPLEWASLRNLDICVSIDGLQPEHDARRKPATYDRILKHIEGHYITVHCTVTRQQLQRDSYLEEFVRFWSDQASVSRIWVSLYTPQKGEVSEERLRPQDRQRAISSLLDLRGRYPKLKMNAPTIRNYADPPSSPQNCTFSRISTCISADMTKVITPCQFGGTPDCANCGCMASAGLEVIGRYQLLPGFPVSRIFDASFRIGSFFQTVRYKTLNAQR